VGSGLAIDMVVSGHAIERKEAVGKDESGQKRSKNSSTVFYFYI
jgi:hypothetical protein